MHEQDDVDELTEKLKRALQLKRALARLLLHFYLLVEAWKRHDRGLIK